MQDVGLYNKFPTLFERITDWGYAQYKQQKQFAIVLTGCSRIVLCVKSYVVKIPTFLFGTTPFMRGLLNNCKEYDVTVAGYRTHLISPVVFHAPFGLFSVQRRCVPLTRELTDDERELFGSFDDVKMDNVGYLDGNLVIFDYAG